MNIHSILYLEERNYAFALNKKCEQRIVTHTLCLIYLNLPELQNPGNFANNYAATMHPEFHVAKHAQ